MTTQTSIALQIVSTLSQEEKEMFLLEFNKHNSATSTISKPKPRAKKFFFPDTVTLARQILHQHRAKHNIPNASKLA